jgi:plastocyanin
MTLMRMSTVAAICFGAIMGCSSSTDSGGGGGGGGHTTNITIGNNFFNPTPDTVPAGIVTFTWSAGASAHNVTWLTGPSTPTPSDTKTSGTYQATLQVGTYTYHCTVHPGMNGTIVVQ